MTYELQDTSITNARFQSKKIKSKSKSYSKTKKSILNKKHNKKQSSTKPSKYTTNNKVSLKLNNLVHYKKIFQHNRNSDKTIILLKKIEFDIFYSCKLKYPLLVKETVTPLTGYTDPNEPSIDRRIITDPFREDVDIPNQYRHTLEDYETIMAYGGSMGHNAAAGQHKTNMSVWSETFLLSNITPQEMVFNSGLWVLMENWCKQLGRNTNLQNITIFTGSIPDKSDKNIKTYIHNINHNSIHTNMIKMNIPLKMFKIICFQTINKPNITHMEILIADNKPYYVNPKFGKFDLNSYIVSHKSYSWFEQFSGINIKTLLEYYDFNTKTIKPFKYFINMNANLSPALRLLMKKSNWFGYLIYSTTIEELDSKWEECKALETEFQNIEFHKQYYEIVRNKLLNDKNSKYKLFG
jgi:DNA/RNA endonuclease G (NUC1)